MSRPHHISAIGAGGLAPEGWPRRDREKEMEGRGQGGRGSGGSFGLIWIVHRIQMSRVLVTDHLMGPGPSGCPAMPRMPPIAETVAQSAVGLSRQAVRYRSF